MPGPTIQDLVASRKAKEDEDNSLLNQAVAGLQRGTGAVAQGLGDAVGLVSNPINAVVNTAGRAVGVDPNLTTDLGSEVRGSLPAAYKAPTEDRAHLLDTIESGTASGLIGAGLAGKVAKMSTAGVRAFADFLAQAPVVNAVGGAAGAGSAEATRQAGGGEGAQFGAGLIGSLIGGGAATLAGHVHSPLTSTLDHVIDPQPVNATQVDPTTGLPIPKESPVIPEGAPLQNYVPDNGPAPIDVSVTAHPQAVVDPVAAAQQNDRLNQAGVQEAPPVAPEEAADPLENSISAGDYLSKYARPGRAKSFVENTDAKQNSAVVAPDGRLHILNNTDENGDSMQGHADEVGHFDFGYSVPSAEADQFAAVTHYKDELAVRVPADATPAQIRTLNELKARSARNGKSVTESQLEPRESPAVAPAPEDPAIHTAAGVDDALNYPEGKVNEVTIRSTEGLKALLEERQAIQPPAEPLDPHAVLTGTTSDVAPGNPVPAPDNVNVSPNVLTAPQENPNLQNSVNLDNLGLTPEEQELARALPHNDKGYRSNEGTAEAAMDVPPDLPKIDQDISSINKAGMDRVKNATSDILDIYNEHGDSPELHNALDQWVKTFETHSENVNNTARGLQILKGDKPKPNARGEVPQTPGELTSGEQKNLNQVLSDPEKRDALVDMLDKHKDDPEALRRIAQALKKPKLSEHLFSLWFNWGLLSGPVTHAKNIFGNTGYLGLDLFNKGFSAALGQRQQLRMHETGDRVLGREVLARLYGAGMGVAQGFSNMKAAYKAGTPLDLVSKIDHPNAFSGRKSYVVEAPSRALAAEDEFARSVAHVSDLYGQAMRIAGKEGLSWKETMARADELAKNPTDEMIAKAGQYSKEMRFQDKMSKAADRIASLTHPDEKDTKIAAAGKAAFRILVPFVHTPDRIMAAVMRNSLLGVFSSRNISDFKAGGALRDQAVARVATGTAVTGYVVSQFANGAITGDNPKAGEPKNSFRVGDHWIPYASLGPIGGVINMAANAAEQYQDGKLSDRDYFHTVSRIGVGVADAIMNNGWMESISEMFKLQSGSPAQQDAARDYFVSGKVASLFVPALLRQTNQMFVDTTKRDTKGDGSIGDKIMGGIKSGIPGQSSTLPAQHDLYGREVGKSVIADDVEHEPAVKELQRLQETATIDKPFLRAPQQTITIPEIGKWKLGAADYEEYKAISGQYLTAAIESVMDTPEYKAMTDDQKKDALKDVVKESHTFAKDQFLQKVLDRSGLTPPADPAPKPTPETGSALTGGTFSAGIPTRMRSTVEGNKRVGGVAHSHHLDGDAIDFVPSKGYTMKSMEQQARKFFGPGAKILNEGTHVHVTLPGLHAPLYGAVSGH